MDGARTRDRTGRGSFGRSAFLVGKHVGVHCCLVLLKVVWNLELCAVVKLPPFENELVFRTLMILNYIIGALYTAVLPVDLDFWITKISPVVCSSCPRACVFVSISPLLWSCCRSPECLFPSCWED